MLDINNAAVSLTYSWLQRCKIFFFGMLISYVVSLSTKRATKY